ncbi:Beta subunit 1 of SnRK1 [Entomortierella lignicola]|nr:Beta subunit 1 of SnRK1 [Entomortierella lignicola]
MSAKPTSSKSSVPSTPNSSTLGQKTRATVGKLAGFSPTGYSLSRTGTPMVKSTPSPTSTIAQARAVLFERAQQGSSPTTLVIAPKRALISSVSNAGTTTRNYRESSSPATSVGSSSFRKPSVSSINNLKETFHVNAAQTSTSPRGPVTNSPLKRSPTSGDYFKDAVNTSQPSSTTTSSSFMPKLRKPSVHVPVSDRKPLRPTTALSPASAVVELDPKVLDEAHIESRTLLDEDKATIDDPKEGLSTSIETVATPQEKTAEVSIKTEYLVNIINSTEATVEATAVAEAVNINETVAIKVKVKEEAYRITQVVEVAQLEVVEPTENVVPDEEASLDEAISRVEAAETVEEASLVEESTQTDVTQIEAGSLVDESPPVEDIVPLEITQVEATELVALVQDVSLVEEIDSVEEFAPAVEVTEVEEMASIEIHSVKEQAISGETIVQAESINAENVTNSTENVVKTEKVNEEIAQKEVSTELETPVQIDVQGETALTENLIEKIEPESLVKVAHVTIDDSSHEASSMESEIPDNNQEEAKLEVAELSLEEGILGLDIESVSDSVEKIQNSLSLPQMFIWSHGGNFVKVTGSFDSWQGTLELRKIGDEFTGAVDLDRRQAIQFKFIVDGAWRCSDDYPMDYDNSGNMNNVLHVLEI